MNQTQLQMVPEIKGRHWFAPRKRASDLGMLTELAAMTGAQEPGMPVRNPVGSELLHGLVGMIMGGLAGGGVGYAVSGDPEAAAIGGGLGAYVGGLGGLLTGVGREVSQGQDVAQDVRSRMAKMSPAALKQAARAQLRKDRLDMSVIAGLMGQGAHQSGRAAIYQRLLQGKPGDSWSAEALDSPQGGFANMIKARDMRDALLSKV